MKQRNKLLIVGVIGLLIGASGGRMVSILDGLTKPEAVSCISLLQERAEKLESQKMIMPNQDGGLFLMSEGSPREVNFIGYVGSKTVGQMREQMANAGLLQIKVESRGTCEAENGLVYTVVAGSYRIPEEKPDPI